MIPMNPDRNFFFGCLSRILVVIWYTQ